MNHTGYKDLIIRWVKSQLRFHGDPVRARRDREETEAIRETINDRMHEDVQRAVVNAVLPNSWKRKMGELEQAAEMRKVEAAQRERAEHEALPREEVQASFGGVIAGQVRQQMPIVVNWPDENVDAVIVQIKPLDPIRVETRSFNGLDFAIPNFQGPGHYDLSALYQRDGESWDPFWFQLFLDSYDEPFYWVPEYGAGTVDVGPDGRTVRLHLPMENAGSERLTVDLGLSLPPT